MIDCIAKTAVLQRARVVPAGGKLQLEPEEYLRLSAAGAVETEREAHARRDAEAAIVEARARAQAEAEEARAQIERDAEAARELAREEAETAARAAVAEGQVAPRRRGRT